MDLKKEKRKKGVPESNSLIKKENEPLRGKFKSDYLIKK